MPDINRESRVGVSAVARAKQRNMLKRQRIAAILIAAGVLLLVAALLFVSYIVDIYVFEDVDGTKYDIKRVDGAYALCHKGGDRCDITEHGGKKYYQTKLGTMVSVNAETGEAQIFAVVDTEGTEVQDFGQYVLMFKQLTYDEDSTSDSSRVIASIEVHNEKGSYKFVRDENEEFVIEGDEDAPFAAESFAQLAVACGYTLSTRRLADPLRLPDGKIDYAEYGLDKEIRVRTETDADGNEIEVEYEYSPAWYIITTMTGESHRVTIGDMTVTGTGYYARYEDRETIYVIGASAISDLLLGRIEDFITPMIVYPMTLTDYFNVSDFRIYDNIDYTAIYTALAEKFGEDEIGSEEFLAEYERLFDLHSHKVCDFYYSDLEERKGSMYAYTPYISKLEYAAGYYLDSNNIDLVLNAFYQTQFGEVVKLSPSDEELEACGLVDAPYVVGFLFKTQNEKGETVYVENFVEISEKNEDGMFYAYSETYDMIVTVDESSFHFLEWDDTYWYDDSYIQMSISNIDSIIIESPAFKTEFTIEDSASKYLGYVGKGGSGFTVGEKEYRVIRDAESGRYVLSSGGERIEPLYVGDYLITPTVYTVGSAESADYIFAESSNADINGDGNNDGYMYYYYDIVKDKSGEYCLVAYVMFSDLQGNKVSDTKVVWGEKAYQSQYFMTQNGYLFFTGEYTAIGQHLTRTYKDQGRGAWGEGSVFVTSGGKYVLINSENGAWCTVRDVTSGLYLADSEDSRLAERAVDIPALYNSDGSVRRYPETYYPMTDKKIAYDEESGNVVAYNGVKKQWEKITYSDCIIGAWSAGEYYVLEGGILILVDSVTGDWGEVAVLSNPTYVANIVSDGKLLDYVIERDGYSESSKIATGMQNFQELYKYFLTASFEDIADLDEAQKETLRKMDDFSTGGERGECVLKVTVKASDFKGNERDVVYRFYRYSERRAYITIEMLDESGESSSEKAYGNFCVLYSFVQKVISDAQKVINGEAVYSSQKY